MEFYGCRLRCYYLLYFVENFLKLYTIHNSFIGRS